MSKNFILTILLLSSTAKASSELLTIEVENKKEERSEDQIIDSSEIQKESPTDMRGLFKKAQSLSVGGGSATGQKVFIRGVEDINLNIQVDGARQGGYLFHHQGALFLEPEFIKSVEVRPGTGRADDGFGALGGTLLMKTKNVFDFADENRRHGGLIKGTFYSNQRYTRPTLALYSMPSSKFGILATGTYKDGNDYSDGRGETVRGSAEKQMSGLVKLSGKDQNFSYDLGYEHVDDEGLRSPRQNFGWDPTADLLSRQESRRDTATLNGLWSPDPTYANIETNVFHTSSEIRRERRNQSDAKADATGVGATIANTIEHAKNRLKFGTDYIMNSSVADNGDEKEINNGLFLQNRLTAIQNVNLDFGARYDDHDFTAGSGKSIKNDALSPNARIEFCPAGMACIFTGYSESFRGIRPAEAVLINGTLNYPSDIEPETSITREAGGSITYNKHHARLVFYKNDIRDLMVINRPTNTRDNAGVLRTEGYEATYEFTDPKFLNMRIGYTQVRPTFNGTTILNQNMGAGTTLGDTWTLNVSKLIEKHGVLFGTYIRLVERVNSATVDKPSYDMYDIFVDYQPKVLPQWKFTLYIANLFNEHFVDHATFFSTGVREQLYSPGRDVRISATYHF